MDVHQDMDAKCLNSTTVQYTCPMTGEDVAQVQLTRGGFYAITYGPLSDKDGQTREFDTEREVFRELDAEWRAICLEAQFASMAMGAPA